MKFKLTLILLLLNVFAFAQDYPSNYVTKKVAVKDSILVDSVSINSSKFLIRKMDQTVIDSSFYTIDFGKALLTFKRPIEMDSITIEYLKYPAFLTKKYVQLDESIIVDNTDNMQQFYKLSQSNREDSFIPFDVKRELGLPTYKEKDAVYTYHFYRILQRAQNIILCYNTEPDVLEGGEKSRLIHQLTTDVNLAPFITQTIASPKVPLKTTETLTISKDPYIMERISELAKRGFSPTALSDYIRDPQTFFKRHIMGIDDPDDVEETLQSRTIGIIIHESLETLYKPFIGSILKAEELNEQRKKIKPLVKSLMAEHYPDQNTIQGKNLIAFEVIAKYIDRLIINEIEASREHKIRILALETRMTCLYPVPNLQQ